MKLFKQIFNKQLLIMVWAVVMVVGLNACSHVGEQQPVTLMKKEVHYQVNGVALTGYMVYPEGKKNLPGVLIVHEWWGHNAYARQRAEMLAELGYAAFALDLYGDGKVANHPADAKNFMTQALSTEGAIQQRFTAALELLKDAPVTDDHKMAAIGYCFGGGVVLSMARAGLDLDGVVSFHGSLQNLAPIAPNVHAKFLVLNGAADPFILEEHKQLFKTSMQTAKLQYEFVDYPGVLHGFTNPDATAKGEQFSLPLKYDAAADQASWQKMQAFLQSVF